MITIRKPNEGDFQAVLGLIKDFQAEAIDEYGLYCEDAKTLELMPRYLATSMVMENDGQVIGVIAGVITSYPLNQEPVFQEQLWYVKKKYRAKSIFLLEAMEYYVKNVSNVKKMVMCGFGETHRKVKDRFFRRRGYKVLETHYIKAV